jgi:hypothetical protein
LAFAVKTVFVAGLNAAVTDVPEGLEDEILQAEETFIFQLQVVESKPSLIATETL